MLLVALYSILAQPEPKTTTKVVTSSMFWTDSSDRRIMIFVAVL